MPGATGTPHEEVPAGTRPGTAFTLTLAPTSPRFLHLNGVRLKDISPGTPGVGEYALSGTAVTTGDTIEPADEFTATWWLPGPIGFVPDAPTGARPGTTFSLSITPTTGILLVLNGVLLQLVGSPGIGEYALSGTTITTGDTVESGDYFQAYVF